MSFAMNTASRVVRFLAQDEKATWEPYGDGVLVHHEDCDERFSKSDLVCAAKNYAYEISEMEGE